jgi:hypothetical protein
MKRLEVVVAAAWVCLALSLAAAFASPASAAGRACCEARAGTVVQVELAQPVSTKHQRSGDTFAFRLAAPLIVDGRILLPAGTLGVGEVVTSAKPGLGGKSAKLVLAARYLSLRRTQVPLQALQLSAAGKDNSTTAQAVGLTGIAFAPLGFVGLAIRGGDVEFPAGTRATAKLASDMFLPSRGRASRSALAEARSSMAADAADNTDVGSIEIAPPPPGDGQVVFFRAKSLLGTGQWFNVREDGKALGKLTNGAYFVQVTTPGQHTYTATTEPELKDHLRLEIDAGETYFVEGTLTKGVVIGTANISPSDRAAFDKASKDLKLAPPPSEEKASDLPADSSAAASDTASAPSNTASAPSNTTTAP